MSSRSQCWFRTTATAGGFPGHLFFYYDQSTRRERRPRFAGHDERRRYENEPRLQSRGTGHYGRLFKAPPSGRALRKLIFTTLSRDRSSAANPIERPVGAATTNPVHHQPGRHFKSISGAQRTGPGDCRQTPMSRRRNNYVGSNVTNPGREPGLFQSCVGACRMARKGQNAASNLHRGAGRSATRWDWFIAFRQQRLPFFHGGRSLAAIFASVLRTHQFGPNIASSRKTASYSPHPYAHRTPAISPIKNPPAGIIPEQHQLFRVTSPSSFSASIYSIRMATSNGVFLSEAKKVPDSLRFCLFFYCDGQNSSQFSPSTLTTGSTTTNDYVPVTVDRCRTRSSLTNLAGGRSADRGPPLPWQRGRKTIPTFSPVLRPRFICTGLIVLSPVLPLVDHRCHDSRAAAGRSSMTRKIAIGSSRRLPTTTARCIQLNLPSDSDAAVDQKNNIDATLTLPASNEERGPDDPDLDHQVSRSGHRVLRRLPRTYQHCRCRRHPFFQPSSDRRHPPTEKFPGSGSSAPGQYRRRFYERGTGRGARCVSCMTGGEAAPTFSDSGPETTVKP